MFSFCFYSGFTLWMLLSGCCMNEKCRMAAVDSEDHKCWRKRMLNNECWLHEIWWNWGNDEEWLWWTHTDLDLDPNYLSHFYVVLAVINHRLKWLRQVVHDVVGSIQYLFVTYVHNYRSNNLIFMHFTTEMRLLLLVIRILCFVSDFFLPFRL